MATRNGAPESGANVEARPPPPPPQPQHHRKVALIAGITGQDGSYLTEFLLDRGYEVHGLIHRPSNFNTRRVGPIHVDTHGARMMKLHCADLTDASSLRRCMDTISPDEVYNLAARSDVAVSFPADVVATVAVALHLLEAVRSHVSATGRSHIRYCHAGSSDMLGRQSERRGSWKRQLLSETSPFHPRSPYGASQLAAYWYNMHYREAYGLFACNAILFNHESPRQGENSVARKITRAVGRIKIGLQSKLFLADLENVDDYRDWGFAGDYVEAMWMMLQQEKPDDYAVATGKSRSVEYFLDEALGCAGLRKDDHVIEEGYVMPAEVDYFKGDASKARKVLGWKPKVGFEELVKMMVDEDIELAKFEKLLVDAGYNDDQQQP